LVIKVLNTLFFNLFLWY